MAPFLNRSFRVISSRRKGIILFLRPSHLRKPASLDLGSSFCLFGAFRLRIQWLFSCLGVKRLYLSQEIIFSHSATCTTNGKSNAFIVIIILFTTVGCSKYFP